MGRILRVAAVVTACLALLLPAAAAHAEPIAPTQSAPAVRDGGYALARLPVDLDP